MKTKTQTDRGRADIWMPLYIADYARDTFHLTRDQHGGYMLLLMACWIGGGKLPNDPAKLAAIAKATPREWLRLSPVLLPFFKIRGEWLVHKRVSEERARADKLIETRRKNGRKGGRPKTEKEPVAKLPGGLDETPARVTVTVSDSSELAATQRFSSQEEASDSEVGSKAAVIPLAGRMAR
jgi:uncharacterized protein YdaU (DUF1376 family)